MRKTTKVFLFLFIFYLMGVMWGWWQIQSFVGGFICLGILLLWLAEPYLDSMTYYPDRRARNKMNDRE